MRYMSILSVVLAIAIMFCGPAHPNPSDAMEQSIARAAAVSVTDAQAPLVVEVESQAAFDDVLDYAWANSIGVSFSSRATGILTLDGAEEAGSVAAQLAEIEGVLSVSTEQKARLMYTPNDPYLDNQWSLDTINAFEAWDIGRGSSDIVVAILDTGIDWTHEDLDDNMWTNADGYHGYNFIDDNWLPMDDNINGYDDTGTWLPNIYTYHGTHVAGIVAAEINNNEGVAGLAQIRLMAVKVMNDSGEGTDATVAAGLRWAVDNGARIVVMSLGVEGVSITLQNAVQYASNRGVTMVAAAGNSGTSYVSYPAAFPQVIAVGATDSTDRRASFSNFGDDLDVMAPGVQIYSTQGGGSYQYLSGTSAAAPHVAGVAAIMLSINPALTPEDIGDAINSTATDISRTGYDTSTGWGIVNAFEAVELVAMPTVTITDYPEYVEPNSTFSIEWLVSGGDPGTIQSTYLEWGLSPTALTETTSSFTGTTWARFTASDILAPGYNATIYARAYAQVDGVMYESELVEVPVMEAPLDGFFMQFINDVERFIMNDLGLTNFLIILAVLIGVPLIVLAARPRRRTTHVYTAPVQHTSSRPSSLTHYEPVRAAIPAPPPPPPPPPRFEAYIDVVGHEIVPQTVRVIEGTKVVWVNRTWAPPPGIAIKSGRLDSSGEHSDGLFQSGLLIAPGDYWSCTFHRAGEYDYFLTGIWKSARIIVEPYSPGPGYAPRAA